MMKYRIKIVTFKNGRKEYTPYFKKWYGWHPISSDGYITNWTPPCGTMQSALCNIDRHHEGNSTIQNIEFKYITK